MRYYIARDESGNVVAATVIDDFSTANRLHTAARARGVNAVTIAVIGVTDGPPSLDAAIDEETERAILEDIAEDEWEATRRGDDSLFQFTEDDPPSPLSAPTLETWRDRED